MIFTVVIAVLIFFYAGWVIYKAVKNARAGKSCHGCGKCSHGKKYLR